MFSDLETRLRQHAAGLESVAPRIDLPEIRSIAAATTAQDVRAPIYFGSRKKVIGLVVLAVVLIAAAVSYALRSETVEEGPSIGAFIEMALDHEGLPFIAYSDADEIGTTFAKCADRFCAEGTEFTHFNGMLPTIVMRDDGRPLIWMDGRDGVQEGPWLLDCDNPACSAYTPTDIAYTPTSFSDIAESGSTLVTYENRAGDLVIGTCDDSVCADGIAETVVTNAQYANVVQAFLDPFDRPVLIFVHNSALHFVRCRTSDCSTGYDRNVVATGDFEDLTPADVVIGSDGVPWIAHGRYGNQIVRCSDEVCTSSLTVPLGTDENAWALSALLASDEVPLFVYNWSESNDTMVLKVARCSDASCMKGTIATIHRGSLVVSFSATLGDDGKPVIAFRAEDGVLAITCGDAACTDGALGVAHWDHTEPDVATTLPTGDRAPTTVVSLPPGDSTSGPLFEPGAWIRIADFDSMFDCTWDSGDDAFARSCKPAASSALGLSADVHLVSMVDLQDTLVVVTQACQTPPNPQADEPESAFECTAAWTTSWTSTNGRNWSPSLIAEMGWVEWLVTGDAGLVAVGQTCDADGSCIPAVWTSPDGVTWLPAASGSLPNCTGLDITFQCITGVVGGPDHYIMHGHDVNDHSLWLSSDGAEWRPIDLGLAEGYVAFGQTAWNIEGRVVGLINVCGPLTDEEAQLLLWDEVRDQSTYFGDLSMYGEHSASCSRSLWISDDGSTWAASDAADDFGLMSYFEGFSMEGGLLIGEVCQDRYTCEDRVWTSSDGLTWDTHHLEEIRTSPGGPIVATKEGLVSAGVVFDRYDTGEWLKFVWVSQDGLEWIATEFDGDHFPNEIGVMASYGSGIVIIDDGRGDILRPDLAGVWTWAPLR